MFFIERHYLRKYSEPVILARHAFPRTKACDAVDASFAENFYGLMRRRTPLFETPRADSALGRPADEQPLSAKDARRSLVFLVCPSTLQVCNVRLNFSLQVGLPYLRAKAQDYYESVGGGIDLALLDDFQRERYLAAPQVRGALALCRPNLSLDYRLDGSASADCLGAFILGAIPHSKFGYLPITSRICSTSRLSTDHGSPGWVLMSDARA